MPLRARSSRLRPAWTAVGRVVYNRKPHLFRIADLYRVMDHVFTRLADDPSVLASTVYDLSIKALEIILLRFGTPFLAKAVYLVSYRLIDWFIQFLAGWFGRKDMEKYATGIRDRLKPWLPPEGPGTFQRT